MQWAWQLDWNQRMFGCKQLPKYFFKKIFYMSFKLFNRWLLQIHNCVNCEEWQLFWSVTVSHRLQILPRCVGTGRHVKYFLSASLNCLQDFRLVFSMESPNMRKWETKTYNWAMPTFPTIPLHGQCGEGLLLSQDHTLEMSRLDQQTQPVLNTSR